MAHKYRGKQGKQRPWTMLSKEFNHDPEVKELRIKFHDWMGFVWQEMISIADGDDGLIKGSDEMLALNLAHISLSKRPSTAQKCILKAIPWMEKKGWIMRQSDGLLVAKYAEYHANAIAKRRKREEEKTIQDKIRVDETLLRKKSRKERKDVADVSIAAYPEQFREVWDLYPALKRIHMGDAERAWNKIQGWNDYSKIIDGLTRWEMSANWRMDEGKFVPKIADFLGRKDYLDTPPAIRERETNTAELVEIAERTEDAYHGDV